MRARKDCSERLAEGNGLRLLKSGSRIDGLRLRANVVGRRERVLERVKSCLAHASVFGGRAVRRAQF